MISGDAVDVDGESEGLASVVDDGKHDQIVMSESAARTVGLAMRSVAAKSKIRWRSVMVANRQLAFKTASRVKVGGRLVWDSVE